jgi:hypothetical protein
MTKDSNGLTPYDAGFDPENIVQYGVSSGLLVADLGSLYPLQRRPDRR